METTENRLMDEARHEPVKNVFRLGWEFIIVNRTLALMTVAAFVLLTLLELVPIVGLAASVAVGVFAQSVQIYVGRAFAEAASIDAFLSEARLTTLSTFLTRYQAPAFGAWLGWFVISMGAFIIWMTLALSAGFDPTMLEESIADEAQLMALMEAMGLSLLPVLLIGLLIIYVYPIAQGRVILSDTFGDAFKAVFSVFLPSVWKAAAEGEYFRFLFVFGLALLGIGMLVGIAMMLLFLIPLFGPILFALLTAGLFYVMFLVMAIASVLARSMVEAF
ncbi:hypothetical protein WCX72_01750 [Sulfurimonas sp. HSL1-6]|uniref:hypothetical protein n=1 Tax=Thiomicrolovo immobilis TaxID=3131935 RepID=UPI0031F8972F